MGNRNNGGQQKYVGAPFNFVPFCKKVVPVEPNQMNVRGSFGEEKYTGEISYTVTAKTPICIDDGQGNFFRNEYNEIAIPGSSMRGLIRNNVQILGLSSFDDDIDDYTLMYRDVTGGVDQERYGKILNADTVTVDGGEFSILKNVSAGYISCEGGKYYIYRTDVDSLGDNFVHMNYYIISARKILKNLNLYPFFRANRDCLMYRLDCVFMRVVTFKGLDSDGNEQVFSYETNDELEWLAEEKEFYYRGALNQKKFIIAELSDKPIKEGECGKCSNRPMVHYVPKDEKKGENVRYVPYFKKVLYKKTRNGINIESIKKYDPKDAEGYLEGYLLGTGTMQEKKVLYIIPKINMEKGRIEIQEQDIKAYEVDYKKRENTLVSRVKDPELKETLSSQIKKFFSLPEEGEKKPVFYIEPDKNNDIKRLYFGYTPRLRLFYSHSVKEGDHQDAVTYDYARSIFGTAESKEESKQNDQENRKESRKAYRSKISFTDAVLQKEPQYEGEYKLILGEPKPSSFYDYIERQNEVTTYNDDSFNLRGVKQYWLASSLHQLPEGTGKNEKVPSLFRALQEGSIFKGAIRFQNLSEAELGLLLWSIRLQDNSCMNIGKAKSYGFGVISVSDIKVKVVDLERAYSLDLPLSLDPFVEKDVDKLIGCYKDTINKKLAGKTIDQMEHIQDFFAIKNYEHLPAQSAIRFMSIDKKEYQDRQYNRVPLATIQEVLAGRQARPVRKRSNNRRGSGNGNAAPREWNFESREPVRRERRELENDHVYEARISKYQGKKVSFQIDKDYYNTSIDNIQIVPHVLHLSRETMRELLPINSRWNIRKHMDEEKIVWEFVAKGETNT